MITERGIKANPVKIEYIRRMKPPTMKKGVQKLTGRLASLNKFISRSAEKSPPFFKVLKGSENLQWGSKQDKAFEDLKQYLENLAVMTSPSPDAELLLYIVTSSSAMSATLVEERMAKGTLKQFPIYFVTEALSGSKLLYSEMEKMAYSVVMAPRKLRHFFRASTLKSQPHTLFGTCLRTGKPPGGLGNGQLNWQRTLLILFCEVPSSPRSS